jgi:hypothetical protein
MNIHYLSHSTFPSFQPSGLQAMKMCEAFAALGHDVLLFGFENPGKDKDEFASIRDSGEKSGLREPCSGPPLSAAW